MGFLSPKMPALPPVQPLPEPPDVSDEEKKRLKAEQDSIQRRRKGRASTILTSPLVNEATTENKTLLGG